MSTALITGATAGLGRALAGALTRQGWHVVIDARGADALARTAAELGELAHPVAGDVTDPEHRADLVEAVGGLGQLDLLVNNASTLGASPLPHLADLEPEVLEKIWSTNVAAPLALTRGLLPALRAGDGVVVDISSDAAIEHYEGWGGYAASKAALDHLTLTLAAEEPRITAYAVDPGDMRTAMHQRAFPGEDISDRPEPESAVAAMLALLAARPASGRYRSADLAAGAGAAPHQEVSR